MVSRGFIFSMEAALAVFLMVAVLISLSYFSYQSEASPYAKLHLERLGKDALAVLDADGTLHSGNITRISQRLNSTLPADIGWRATISTYYKETSNFNMIEIMEFGQAVPDSSVYEVRRDFVNIGTRVMNYSIARMKVWKK